MQPRIKRYKKFIEQDLIPSLLWNKDYSVEAVSTVMKRRLHGKKFRRIVFSGMGCSAIVSDVIKGFFAEQKIPVHVEVVNDYDVDYLIDPAWTNDPQTLFIISSYSGYSSEPVFLYEKIKHQTKNILFLTSGGKLGEIGKKDNISIVYWKLRKPDREYPLFHVPQYFSILLDLFFEFGVLKNNYQKDLRSCSIFLKKYHNRSMIKNAQRMAKKMKGRDIVLLASPKWYLTLLKLADMHLNEMAMVPSHRNYFHEFTHSEVAVFTDPKKPLGIILFRDHNEDAYTRTKMKNVVSILSARHRENKHIEIAEVQLNQKTFINNFFQGLLFTNELALALGKKTNTKSRELISRTAGNPWYNQKTIQAEQA